MSSAQLTRPASNNVSSVLTSNDFPRNPTLTADPDGPDRSPPHLDRQRDAFHSIITKHPLALVICGTLLALLAQGSLRGPSIVAFWFHVSLFCTFFAAEKFLPQCILDAVPYITGIACAYAAGRVEWAISGLTINALVLSSLCSLLYPPLGLALPVYTSLLCVLEGHYGGLWAPALAIPIGWYVRGYMLPGKPMAQGPLLIALLSMIHWISKEDESVMAAAVTGIVVGVAFGCFLENRRNTL